MRLANQLLQSKLTAIGYVVISLPTREFVSSLYPHQMDFLKSFDNRKATKNKYFLLNWHRRARKTSTALNIILREANAVPDSLYLIVTPSIKHGKDIIWSPPNMIERWLPHQTILKKNNTDLKITFKNKSILQICGTDSPSALKSIKGRECRIVWIDEFPESSHPEAWYEHLFPIINGPGEDPDHPRAAIFSFTPKGMDHMYDIWTGAANDNKWYRSLVDIYSSGMFTSEQIEEIKKQQRHPRLFDQEYCCSFLSDEEFVIITSKMLDELRTSNTIDPRMNKSIGSIDPAFGGDACSMMAFNNYEVVDQKSVFSKSEDVVISQAATFLSVNNLRHVIVDSIGNGNLIAYKLEEMGFNVIRFDSRKEDPQEADTFANWRAGAYYRAAQKIHECMVAYPEDLEIRRQLSNIRIKPRGLRGKLLLEEKDETKKRINRSPDDADAYVMGLEGIDMIDNHAIESIKRNNYANYSYVDAEAGVFAI